MSPSRRASKTMAVRRVWHRGHPPAPGRVMAGAALGVDRGGGRPGQGPRALGWGSDHRVPFFTGRSVSPSWHFWFRCFKIYFFSGSIVFTAWLLSNSTENTPPVSAASKPQNHPRFPARRRSSRGGDTRRPGRGAPRTRRRLPPSCGPSAGIDETLIIQSAGAWDLSLVRSKLTVPPDGTIAGRPVRADSWGRHPSFSPRGLVRAQRRQPRRWPGLWPPPGRGQWPTALSVPGNGHVLPTQRRCQTEASPAPASSPGSAARRSTPHPEPQAAWHFERVCRQNSLNPG